MSDEIKDAVLQYLGYALGDLENLVGNIAESLERPEAEVYETTLDLLKDGTLFEPEQGAVQRTDTRAATR